ncbi:MAG: hypothetical protein IT314_00950 [Anaerolineales bacterium]|nr:hypothetical protein [Anaerolineales bacterium]
MEFDPQDSDVVALLAKLKSTDVQYPSDLFFPRRLAYTTRAAQLALGDFTKLANTPKSRPGGGAATTIGRIFEILLLVAIVAEALATAYFYREQITDFIRVYTIRTPTTASIPPVNRVPPLPEVTATPSITLTGTPTPSVTVTPSSIGENNESNEQTASTPDLKSNNGNHYGQTPQPERTKDKGNNGNGDKDKDK